MICGSEEIKQTIEDHLGIHDGETTEDGYFTLKEVECLGACVNAPMVQINDDFYEKLTPASTRELLDACRADQPPPMSKWGSKNMNGQLSCEVCACFALAINQSTHPYIHPYIHPIPSHPIPSVHLLIELV